MRMLFIILLRNNLDGISLFMTINNLMKSKINLSKKLEDDFKEK